MGTCDLNFYLAKETTEVACQFVAGAIGGIAGLAVGHPLDTVKTLVQNADRKPKLRTIFSSVYNMGVTSFFRGLSVPVYSYTLVNALTFASYKYSLHSMDPTGRSPSCVAVSGAIAGAMQLFPSIPVEVLKIKQQKDANKPRPKSYSLVQDIRYIIRKNGFNGLFVGTRIQACRDIPAFTIYFWTYAELVQLAEARQYSPLWATFFSGAISGTLSWLLTMPLDVVKTRLQTGSETDFYVAGKNLMAKEGVLSLMRGTEIALLRAFVVNACIFCVYEESYKYLVECLPKCPDDCTIHRK